MFTINQLFVTHIKAVEGLRLLAYDDKQPNKIITSAKQLIGKLTIGFGHTATVKVGQKITEQKAVELLKTDIPNYEALVNKYITAPINQNMFNALTSFAYNLPTKTFINSSVVRLTNQGKYQEASKAFFNFLVPTTIYSRRQAESTLYMKDYAKLPLIAPSKKKVKSNPFFDVVRLGFALAFLG